jgi:hypothetical protein
VPLSVLMHALSFRCAPMQCAQVITSAEFHPKHCNIFAYSSSKGCIRLADMRDSALCDRHAKAYEEVDTTVSKLAGARAWYIRGCAHRA